MTAARNRTTTRPPSWGEALDGYLAELRAAGRARGTVRLHRTRLLDLAALHPDPWRVTTSDLVQYLGREGWAPETRKSVRQILRGFYRWGAEEGHIDPDPAARLRPVRVPAAVPRPAPDEVVRQALAHADERLALVIELAAFGGLRASEIARVHSSDLVGDVLRVHGKGGKVREVPIVAPDLLARLRAVDGWAFPNRWTGQPITAGHVTKMVSEALPRGWTAHTLRHRMASQAYAGSRDLLSVGMILGHSRPETTQRYVRIPDDALRSALTHVDQLSTLLERLCGMGRRPRPRAVLFPPVTAPCPPWCELPEGHGYENDGDFVRAHTRIFDAGRTGASVTAWTEALSAGGPEVTGGPEISVRIDNDLSEPLTPHDARTLAKQLSAAADAADAIVTG